MCPGRRGCVAAMGDMTTLNDSDPHHEVIVVGSGFAGLCMGVHLRRAGIEDFVILEKDKQFGGTWQANDYPGAACDVPVHLYSFSFAQRAGWSRRFPSRQELWEYTQRITEDFGLMPHIQVATGMEGASYDEDRALWHVRTARGAMSARVLVSATGALSHPSIPELPGLETFAGRAFHSSRWDRSYNLRGKRVAVIGTGASAIQFVPQIAPNVAQLALFQRTPPWILPRPDRRMTAIENRLLESVPLLRSLYRLKTYPAHEVRALALVYYPALAAPFRQMALRHLKRQIADPKLRARLTPSYALGCKRVLLSNDYYPTLERPNVQLITDGIAKVRFRSIVTQSGQEHPVDAIIFGTGFYVEHAMAPVPIRGAGGALLHEVGEGGLEGYKGCAVAGFPNYFMIAGPNTGTGHNSMIYMIEACAQYVTQAIRKLREDGLLSLDVKPSVQARYNRTIQKRLARSVWASGCKSWYLDHTGRNRTLWPGFTFAFQRITRRFDAGNYVSRRR